MTTYRPTVAEVDLDAIRHNCRELGRPLPDGLHRLAVVKADGYGHGDVAVARAVLEAGATWLGVALVEEGVRLREAGIAAPILVLIEAPTAAAGAMVDADLTPSISTREAAEAVSEAAAVAGTTHGVHLCVDTGMHREGVPLNDAVDLAVYTAGLAGLELGGVWSHLAVADDHDRDDFTAAQAARFSEVCSAMAGQGIDVGLRHLANSAGILGHPDTHFDMVRMGVALYGMYPAPWLRASADLRPAMTLRSAVGQVRRVPAGDGVSYGQTFVAERDTTIATVPIGYADGFARLLSDQSAVLIGGKRRQVAGRVTMDSIMVDCGDDPVEDGDEVICIGRQGGAEITAGEVADAIGTIHYEVLSSVGARVPRVYVP